MKNLFFFFPMLFILICSCKKHREESFPPESYLKLLVDGKTYEYQGKELGGTYAQGWSTSAARTMLYTTGLSINKPGFYISAEAPGLTTNGKYWVSGCSFGVDPMNGPYFNITNSMDPEKRKLIITRLNPSQLQWEGSFHVEVIDSVNNTKLTSGTFAISIK